MRCLVVRRAGCCVPQGGLKPENIVIQSAGSGNAKFVIAPDIANMLPPATHGLCQVGGVRDAWFPACAAAAQKC